VGENCLFEDPNLRIRNVRQAEAASNAASGFKHEADVCGHGGHAHRGYLGGPGGEYRLSEVSFCEYAMRGSPGPHPTLLVSPSTKWTYAVTVDIIYRANLGGPGVNIAYSRTLICEYAMRGSPRPHPALIVSLRTKWTYAARGDMPIVCISEGLRVNIVYWRSHFANTQCEAVQRCIRRC